MPPSYPNFHSPVSSASACKALAAAITVCPPKTPLYNSLRSLSNPLTQLSHLTALHADSCIHALKKLVNFADDVTALLRNCRRSNHLEYQSRLADFRLSAVHLHLELDAIGFFNAFHPSHQTAIHIDRLLASLQALPHLATFPHSTVRRLSHSLPTILSCLEHLNSLPIQTQSITHAINRAIETTAPVHNLIPRPSEAAHPLDPALFTSLSEKATDYLRAVASSSVPKLYHEQINAFIRELVSAPQVPLDQICQSNGPQGHIALPDNDATYSANVRKAIISVRHGRTPLWTSGVALKYFNRRPDSALTHSFQHAALVIRTLSHPSLPTFYGIHWPLSSDVSQESRRTQRPMIAVEYLSHNLGEVRTHAALSSFAVRVRILRDVAEAIRYLHCSRVRHGYIHPRNVMLNVHSGNLHGRVKVDISALLRTALSLDDRDVMALLYAPPEYFTSDQIYFTGDVWSFGVLACFVLLDHSHILHSAKASAITRLLVSGQLPNTVSSCCTGIMDEPLKEIISRCLIEDPGARMDAETLAEHMNGAVRRLAVEEEECFGEDEVVDEGNGDEILDSGVQLSPDIVDLADSDFITVENPKSIGSPQLRKQHAKKSGHSEDGMKRLKSHKSPSTRKRPRLRVRDDDDESDDDSEVRDISKSGRDISKVNGDHNELQEVPTAAASSSLSRDDTYGLAISYDKGRGVDRDVVRAAQYYRKASDAGHLLATVKLGLCFEKGLGVRKSIKTAASLFSRASDAGCGQGMIELGRLHERGIGVVESPERAVTLYRKAAAAGFPEGERCLGQCYLEGFGVKEDPKKAIELLESARKRGDLPACVELANCYRRGHPVEQSDEKACLLYRLAAEQGDEISQQQFGLCYYNGIYVQQDDKQAFKWFSAAAAQGEAEACRMMGECYAEGRGVAKDVVEAAKLYSQAVELGNTCAHVVLATCYEHGEGVEMDKKKALQLYRKAAEDNEEVALNNLGVIYEKGEVVKRDYTRAVQYYQRAIEHGSHDALCNLGDCYASGHGVRRNRSKAMGLYSRAAAEGVAGGQCELGRAYYYGQGVAKNFGRAVGLFKQACDGEPEARRRLGVAYYDGQGVEQSFGEAVRLFSQAIEEDNCEANFDLGLCYDEGKGVAQSYEIAFEHFKKAADGGSNEAKIFLGNMYFEGRGVSKNVPAALKLFMEAEEIDRQSLCP